jgi:ParB-like chromosome segregation protein Spo0J
MLYAIEQVRLEDVDLSADLFSCSYPTLHEPLIESVKRLGVLRPVCLVSRGRRWVVAAGLRRALAAHHLGLTHLPCRLHTEPAPSNFTLFLENLEDNLSNRALSFLEKAGAVRRLEQDLDGEIKQEEKRRVYGWLGIPGKAEGIRRYLALDGLDHEIKSFIGTRKLPEQFATLFLDLSPRAARGLIELAKRWHFTASQLREIITLGGEIAMREEMNLQAVLERLEAGLGERGEKSGRAREAFMDLLKKERFPEFSKTKSRIDAHLASFQGMAGIQLSLPPYLEGDAFSARISFRSCAELESRAKALLKYAAHPGLSKAMDLLRP